MSSSMNIIILGISYVKCRLSKLKNYFCVIFQAFFLFPICPFSVFIFKLCSFQYIILFVSFHIFQILCSFGQFFKVKTALLAHQFKNSWQIICKLDAINQSFCYYWLCRLFNPIPTGGRLRPYQNRRFLSQGRKTIWGRGGGGDAPR